MAYLQTDESSATRRSDAPATDEEIAADWQVAADWLEWFANGTARLTVNVEFVICIKTELAEEMAPENQETDTWSICEATPKNAESRTGGSQS